MQHLVRAYFYCLMYMSCSGMTFNRNALGSFTSCQGNLYFPRNLNGSCMFSDRINGYPAHVYAGKRLFSHTQTQEKPTVFLTLLVRRW